MKPDRHNEGRVRIVGDLVPKARRLGLNPVAICTTALQAAIKKMEAAEEEVPASSLREK